MILVTYFFFEKFKATEWSFSEKLSNSDIKLIFKTYVSPHQFQAQVLVQFLKKKQFVSIQSQYSIKIRFHITLLFQISVGNLFSIDMGIFQKGNSSSYLINRVMFFNCDKP